MSYICRVFRKGASAYTSLCLRSVFVHSSFDLRSSFVRPSFDLRSTFVRASFGKRKQAKTNEDKRPSNKKSKNFKPQNLKTLKPQNLKHNANAKRYHLKINDSAGNLSFKQTGGQTIVSESHASECAHFASFSCLCLVS